MNLATQTVAVFGIILGVGVVLFVTGLFWEKIATLGAAKQPSAFVSAMSSTLSASEMLITDTVPGPAPGTIATVTKIAKRRKPEVAAFVMTLAISGVVVGTTSSPPRPTSRSTAE